MNTLAQIHIAMTASELATSALLILGSVFCLLASVGLMRMPDLYTRMQASTKAGTLGVGSLLMAVGVRYAALDVLAMCLVITLFIFLTAPVASHLVARAAYLIRIKPWSGGSIDELAGCYDPETNRLSPSPDEARKAAEAEAPNAADLDGNETMHGLSADEDPDRTARASSEHDEPTQLPRMTA